MLLVVALVFVVASVAVVAVVAVVVSCLFQRWFADHMPTHHNIAVYSILLFMVGSPAATTATTATV